MAQVSPEKLRGGFYTPPSLVAFCLSRIAPLLPAGDGLRVLEPSVGDGAFLRGLAGCDLSHRIEEIVGIEPVETEAERARRTLRAERLPGRIVPASAVEWAASAHDDFDAALGNPPFVRFQFVPTADRTATDHLGRWLGVGFKGVSNLWIPVLLGALSHLRAGGAFAFVVPTECFSGYAAQTVRSWLLTHTSSLHFDLFPAGSFPNVLQEVTVMSGRRKEPASTGRASITITEHDERGASRSWCHASPVEQSWTRYLLEPQQLEAVHAASASGFVKPLGSVAAFEVSIVTGANEFFSTDMSTCEAHGLEEWARPLLPRIRHAPGLRYTRQDHRRTEESGARAWLLDFAEDAPDPACAAGPRRYLEQGIERQLHKRYKCRIRSPWYRVPNIRKGELLLSKRSHQFPKVVLNETGVLTTDTIYRGRVRDERELSAPALACAFHNSLTLLTAELEGRSFGGGVLELVPSEIARLQLPVWPSASRHLERLDSCARQASPEELVAETDAALARDKILPSDLLETLAQTRQLLLHRRLVRNRTSRGLESEVSTTLPLRSTLAVQSAPASLQSTQPAGIL